MVKYLEEASKRPINKVPKYLLLISVILFLVIKASGQEIVKGRIIDENKKPIPNVNLLLFYATSDELIHYAGTDNDGNFQLNFKSLADSVRLEIRSIGFEQKKITLPKTYSGFLEIILKESRNELQEVVIKDDRPIVKKNDTLNYAVNSFSDNADRVIIDVIKRLPGFKVSETGQISYQNKPINKFYIDGKDLLESRYNIASNNLPVDAVETVQVLQNHQPIKLLEGLENSDRAAINIKLNQNAKSKLLGNINASLGLAPLLRENGVSILKFSKDLQFINSLKNNNTGLSLDEELSLQNKSEGVQEGITLDLLSVIKPSRPMIDRFRYRFNNNSLVNGNYIKSLGKSFDIKFDVGLTRDNLSEISSSSTSIFLPTDTIRIFENQTGKISSSTISSGMTLQANTKKAYVNNSFRFSRNLSKEHNFISSLNVNQKLNAPLTNFSNDFGGLIKYKKSVLGITSFTSITNQPQVLTVTPGQFSEVMNASAEYDATVQTLSVRSFFSNNTISATRKIGSFVIGNKASILIKHQEFSNDLSKIISTVQTPVIGNFSNNISRNSIRLSDEAKLTYVKGRLTATIGMNLASISVSNNDRDRVYKDYRLSLNPSVYIRYNFNSSIETSVSTYVTNNIKYEGNASFVLKNYRSLTSTDIPLRKTNASGVIYNLEYKDIVNGIFSNFNASYSKNSQNILLDTRFDGYYSTLTAIELPNVTESIELSLNINKYFANLKSGVDLSILYNDNHFLQLQDGNLSTLYNRSMMAESKLYSKINKSLSIEHTFSFSINKNSLKKDVLMTKLEMLKFINQKTLVKLFLPKDILAKLSVEHYFNNSKAWQKSNMLFADLTVQKTLTKKKIDFALILSNALNTKSFVTYYYNTNILVNSSYNLRPRSVMFRTSFQF